MAGSPKLIYMRLSERRRLEGLATQLEISASELVRKAVARYAAHIEQENDVSPADEDSERLLEVKASA